MNIAFRALTMSFLFFAVVPSSFAKAPMKFEPDGTLRFLTYNEMQGLSDASKRQYVQDLQNFVTAAAKNGVQVSRWTDDVKVPASWSFLTGLFERAQAANCDRRQFAKSGEGKFCVLEYGTWLCGGSTPIQAAQECPDRYYSYEMTRSGEERQALSVLTKIPASDTLDAERKETIRKDHQYANTAVPPAAPLKRIEPTYKEPTPPAPVVVKEAPKPEVQKVDPPKVEVVQPQTPQQPQAPVVDKPVENVMQQAQTTVNPPPPVETAPPVVEPVKNAEGLFLRCSYAGFPIYTKRKEDKCTPKMEAVVAGKKFSCLVKPPEPTLGEKLISFLTPGDKKTPTNAPNETILCNPLVFGLGEKDEPLCVSRNSNATQQCKDKSAKVPKDANGKDAIDKAVALAAKDKKAYEDLTRDLTTMCGDDSNEKSKRFRDGLALSDSSKKDLLNTCNTYYAQFGSYQRQRSLSSPSMGWGTTKSQK